MQLIGRSSSHFTRVPLVLAHELGIALDRVPVYDIAALDPAVFADNPALKLPVLRRHGRSLFGAENICRALAEESKNARRIVWPEHLTDDVSRNAQELVRHGMTAQVQLIMGELVGKLPGDDVYFEKARAGLEGSLRWLEVHLDEVLGALPPARDLSLFEVMLFCLVEHLAFRGTVPVDGYPSLLRFAREHGARPSARATVYRFDAPPTG